MQSMCVILMQYFKCEVTITAYHLLSIQTCEATITYFKYEAPITNASLSFIIYSMKNRRNFVLQMDKEINTWKSN
jgi:hypothetical protein